MINETQLHQLVAQRKARAIELVLQYRFVHPSIKIAFDLVNQSHKTLGAWMAERDASTNEASFNAKQARVLEEYDNLLSLLDKLDDTIQGQVNIVSNPPDEEKVLAQVVDRSEKLAKMSKEQEKFFDEETRAAHMSLAHSYASLLFWRSERDKAMEPSTRMLNHTRLIKELNLLLTMVDRFEASIRRQITEQFPGSL